MIDPILALLGRWLPAILVSVVITAIAYLLAGAYLALT